MEKSIAKKDVYRRNDLKLKEITDINDLMGEVKTYIKDEKQIDSILKAYKFAKEKHDGQLRANGDPYIIHPLTTAYLLAQLRMGPTTIIGGLLHDVIEDTPVTDQEIIDNFGQEVLTLVEAVTKVSYFAKDNREQIKAAYLRKLYLSMAKDIRVMIIKICDRLHNMMTIGNLPEKKQKVIAKETLEIYSTIAHRIGMNNAKGALEDLSFEVLQPEEFNKIGKLVEQERSSRVYETNKLIADIGYNLKDKGINDFDIFGRPKNFYSIYRKITKFGKTFDEIQDILAVRIITKNIDDCYRVLGYIHQKYTPIPNRFKDYIATPKNNLYQSIHTTVSTSNGTIFEVQIRTEEMDEVAEAGAAAHWRYKAGETTDSNKKQQEIDDKLDIFKRILTFEDEKGSETLEKELQEDIFTSSVYVLTPNGKVITLPYGATVLDFAYRIHSEVGQHTIGAKINGVFSPINSVLVSGDVVEVKTSVAQNPNHNWLKIAISPSAKNKIRRYLSSETIGDSKKEEDIKKQVEKIRGTVSTYINSHENKKRKRTDLEALELAKKDGYQSLDDIYVDVIANKLTIDQVVDKYFLKEDFSKDEEVKEMLRQKADWTPNIKDDLIIDGISNIKISIANCCLPIPYEEVVGYVSKGHGIKVHLKDCLNVKTTEAKDRLISVRWNEKVAGTRNYVTKLNVIATNRPNLLYDLAKVLTSLKADVLSMNLTTDQKNYTSAGVIKIKVHDSEQLGRIISSLKSIAGVYDVNRLSETEAFNETSD